MLPNKLSPSDEQHSLETGLSCSLDPRVEMGEQSSDTDSTCTDENCVKSSGSSESGDHIQSASIQQSASYDTSRALSQDSHGDADNKADSDHLQTDASPDCKSVEDREDLYGPDHQMNTDSQIVFKCHWRNNLFPSLKRMGFPRRVPVCRAQVTIGDKTYTACVDSGASTIVLACEVYQEQKHILGDLQPLQSDEKLREATGAHMQIDGVVKIPFSIGEFLYSFEAYVGDLVGVPMLLGMPFLRGV